MIPTMQPAQRALVRTVANCHILRDFYKTSQFEDTLNFRIVNDFFSSGGTCITCPEVSSVATLRRNSMHQIMLHNFYPEFNLFRAVY